MNSYNSVFNSTPQNNRNQFEIPVPPVETVGISQENNTTSAVQHTQVDAELVLKFLAEISKDPVNEHKSSKEKLELAIEMVDSLKNR